MSIIKNNKKTIKNIVYVHDYINYWFNKWEKSRLL